MYFTDLNFVETQANESNRVELEEERTNVQNLADHQQTVPFPLDTTMTIVRHQGRLSLHSVVPIDPQLLAAVQALGEVSLIICPNLQHWLFLHDWLTEFPRTSVALVPEAFGENLRHKMPFLAAAGHTGNVFELETGREAEITRHGLLGSLLEGAPLCLNEYLFFHPASGTLLASDSFYGGYTGSETPTWFARLWFKLTKAGSFRAARLPVYR